MLHAPDLILIEVAGAVVRRVNERQLTPVEAEPLLADWFVREAEGTLRLHNSTAERLRQAARLAIELGHPIKDCVYLALSIELGCPLATCDAKFRDRTVGHHPDVKLLAELA